MMSPLVFARIARLITVVVLTVTGCLLAAGTGWAGGPTSAMLVAPGLERTAAVYYSDPEYRQLETLLAAPAAVSEPAVLPTDGSGHITVTWLIHDVTVWRIDRIYLAADGDHLIMTQLMDGSNGAAMYTGEWGDDTAIKHRTADPAALQALMDKLGLTAAAQSTPAEVALQAASGPNDTVGSPAAPTAEPISSAAAGWWILAGLVLGAVATAVAVRYLPAVRRQVIRESGAAGDEPVQMIRLPV